MTRIFSEVHRKRLSESKKGSKHPFWKGDKVSYISLHEWVRNHLPKPEICQLCGEFKQLDLANITGYYNRELENWEYLCMKCHVYFDRIYPSHDVKNK